jgi:hypothetical protein
MLFFPYIMQLSRSVAGSSDSTALGPEPLAARLQRLTRLVQCSPLPHIIRLKPSASSTCYRRGEHASLNNNSIPNLPAILLRYISKPFGWRDEYISFKSVAMPRKHIPSSH